VEIFGIGLPEVLLIIVVALVFVGPERLPEAARTIGKTVGDFRRAIEPARGAWRDLTSEITSVGNEVTSTVRTVGTATSASINGTHGGIKPARPGEVVTAVPSDNPWSVHPIMKNMTAEERANFMANGQVPARISQELRALESAEANQLAYAPQVVDLDYPMPHAPAAAQTNPAAPQPVEDIDYPETRPAVPGNNSAP
jgi:Tat protein translocase TatB subunit